MENQTGHHANLNNVYIIGSSSISALGAQDEINTMNDENIKLTNIEVENKTVPYYQIKGSPLHKTFEDMVEILSSQIKAVINQTNLTQEQLTNTVLCLGSTSLDIDAVIPNESKENWLSQTDKLGQALVKIFNLHTIHFTFNTACTSSANALLYASKLIQRNKIEHAIVVGFEFFNQLSINGFDSLDLMSKKGVKPFSKIRDGLLLGEGVGAIILSNTKNELTQFEFLGGYSSCDDYSLTITDESGSHIVEVVKHALSNANVTSNDINVVKIHGTASEKSDLAEFNALNLLFEKVPPLIGFKSLVGHTLGACGILEITLLNKIMQSSNIPHCHYQYTDKNYCLLPFIKQVEQLKSSCILLNHFGFGGNNAALILKQICTQENTFYV